MKLIEKINKDFIDAYKAKNMGKKNFLGLIKGEASRDSKDPSDEEVLKVLKKMEKSLATSASNSEILKDSWTIDDEIATVQSYLPTLMSEEEIEKELHIIMSTCSAEQLNIGYLMGSFNKEFKGKADNKIVSKLIKEMLG